jgi:adenosylcobyric acid synthase
LADLDWLRPRGLAAGAADRRCQGTPVLGICGGYQMLGATIVDELGVETRGSVHGLDLLPITTTFASEKVTERVTAHAASTNAFWPASTQSLDAYEIHMGRTTPLDGATLGAAPFTTTRAPANATNATDGATSADGLVVGTYMHGLLENESLRRAMLANLAARKGIALPAAAPLATVDQAIDTLADAVAAHLDLDAIGEMVGLSLSARV